MIDIGQVHRDLGPFLIAGRLEAFEFFFRETIVG
jgi:hypothetical protein